MNTYCKVSLMYGDITKAQVDIIVNAANEKLGGGMHLIAYRSKKR